ncbi:Gfo/Idh/MocA family protein [Nocardioides speluncae]|uniref:Gfo/Idh/MocA family protein n=1 Tax=Nocardioides speluncae TaxID=2670337 RepID=UPI001F0B9E6A|nr:Gfo/Idh/MocA family oxidoreductase [Nocardioides speluncae]
MSVTAITTTVAEQPDERAGMLRVGVVGAGFIAGVHARSARTAQARLVGVVASSPERAAGAAETIGAERGYADLDAMLAAAELDVLHVCTPNSLHLEAVVAAAAAGVHVICEKPLATTAQDAATMVAVAAEAGVVGAVPFVYRFHPMVRELRARVRAGAAGNIASLHGSYLQDWLSRPEDDSWRLQADSGGALRAFGDIGSHWCDLLEYVADDRIARLSARTAAVVHRPDATTDDDVATVSFETASGRLGVLVISQVAAGRKNRLTLEISGTEASFAFDQENPELLWVGGRDGSRLLQRDPATLSPDAARLSHLPAGHAQGYQDCFNAFVADSYAASRGQQPAGLPTFEDGLRAATLAETVLASVSDNGAWTEVAR